MWLLFAVEEQGIFAKLFCTYIIASKHFALKFDFTVRDLLRESVQFG